MNVTQLKYARERAAAIYQNRRAAIEASHTEEAVRLSSEELHVALRCGDFEVREPLPPHPLSLRDYLVFPAETTRRVDRAAIEAETVALTKEYDALVEQLVLGDNSEAIELLARFVAS